MARRHLPSDGLDRSYRLFTPTSFPGRGAAVPLVLALHGAGNSGDSFAETTQLDLAATANGFVVAYPDAHDKLWNGGFCCNGGRGDPAVDVRFLEGVIADAASVAPVDPARVYAMGVSAGGVMAYRLACDRADLVAGIVVVAGSMQLDDCRPSRPVPALVVHGTADQLVPYEGGVIRGAAVRPAPPTEAVADLWASLDRCPGPPAHQVDGPVAIRTWTGCAAGAAVRLVTVDGGGHSWFAREFGPPNGAVDATTAGLDFLGLTRR